MALDPILHFGLKPRTIQEVMWERDRRRGVVTLAEYDEQRPEPRPENFDNRFPWSKDS